MKPKRDNPTWTDPVLGEFQHAGLGWVQPREFAAFAAFNYVRFGRPTKQISFGFLSPFIPDGAAAPPPTSEAVNVARALVESQQAIADRVATAIWDELNGRGPKSLNWWRGQLNDVREKAIDKDVGPLAEPSDVPRLMRLREVLIAPFADDSEQQLAQLMFLAAFEPEHGVAILTDGQMILGTGYSMEVQPFKK